MVNPIIKPCELGPKQIISYHLRRGITYGIRAIVQPEMRVHKPMKVTSEDVKSQEGVIVTSHTF